jgi:hypothetical protein
MLALYIIAGIILVILLVAAFAGTKWQFERSILINAPLEKVWQNTNSLHAINRWNPWLDRDPNVKQEYSGTDGAPGAIYAWDSPEKNVGAGNQTITGIKENSEMTSRINFIRPFAGVGDAWIRLEHERGTTRATWGIASSTPYPMNIMKVFGVIEKNLNRDFTKGLGQLKSLSEQ